MRSFDGFVVDILAVRATSGHCYSLGLRAENLMPRLDEASDDVKSLMPVGIHMTGAEFYAPIFATGLDPAGRLGAMMCSLPQATRERRGNRSRARNRAT